jgi:hypothetical protein
LGAIGYCGAAIVPAVTAFQRRFRPSRIDGEIDRETAMRLIEVREVYSVSRTADRASRGMPTSVQL